MILPNMASAPASSQTTIRSRGTAISIPRRMLFAMGDMLRRCIFATSELSVLPESLPERAAFKALRHSYAS